MLGDLKSDVLNAVKLVFQMINAKNFRILDKNALIRQVREYSLINVKDPNSPTILG